MAKPVNQIPAHAINDTVVMSMMSETRVASSWLLDVKTVRQIAKELLAMADDIEGPSGYVSPMYIQKPKG